MNELDQLFDRVSEYFSVLAEPSRLKILHALCDGEKSVGAVLEDTGLTQTNVSRHINAMQRAGVLARRKEGTTVFYSIVDQACVDLCRTVCVQIAAQLDHTPTLNLRTVKSTTKRFERAVHQLQTAA